MLRGMVDTKKEIGKLEEKITKINSQLENLEGMKSMEGYEEKVCPRRGGPFIVSSSLIWQ